MKRAGLVLALAFVLASCAERGSDQPRIEPRICIGQETRDQGDLVPDLSSIVDCGTPHVYEVYDIIDLPPEALTGSTKQKWADNRDDLALPSELTNDSTHRQAFEKFSQTGCVESLQQVTGLDQLKLGDVGAAEARVIPALRGVNALRYTVMPQKQWLDGKRQVVCSARFQRADYFGPGRTPVQLKSSADHARLITLVRESSLPVELRRCRSYDEARETVSTGSCAKPHVGEMLFHFEADAVFDEKFIESIVTDPSPKKFDRFDDVCTESLPQLLGKEVDMKKVRGFGSIARRWTAENKTVRCDVGPIDFKTNDLAPGSLVGADTTKLLPSPSAASADAG